MWRFGGFIILLFLFFRYVYAENPSMDPSVDPSNTLTKLESLLEEYVDQQLAVSYPDVLPLAREARGKKGKKYTKFILPMILGALLVKSLILPVVLKGLAFLSTKAVLLSILSLIVASISGLKRSARSEDQTEVQVYHVPLKSSSHYRRSDDNVQKLVVNDEEDVYITTTSPYRGTLGYR